MAARETLVFLVLPWKPDPLVERRPSKKAARVYAERLVEEYAALDLEIIEDADGDLVVQEAG